ncbi:hypothetical protein [Desulfosporosinus sp. I2]|uniref:hypothetical protein n=1 Tax=Desulfosporosinus sp. I2 TaxID=1617025 RepID=UPI0005EDAD43|nr:hypothetical protein [Desulfosporosinus sp. I2]
MPVAPYLSVPFLACVINCKVKLPIFKKRLGRFFTVNRKGVSDIVPVPLLSGPILAKMGGNAEDYGFRPCDKDEP